MPVRKTTTVVVIGAGHAGLAMSRCLADRSIDHVVLERGEVANSWRNERWDSLRLLTPNWQSRLPGFGYIGSEPDGFRNMGETISFIERYADVIAAPIQTRTTVTRVRPAENGYEVETDRGIWRSRCVVIATGACNSPRVPAVAEHIPSSIATLSALEYRNPSQLQDGGVLIVGASSTGTQIADEIHRSGRPVSLAVGEHVRVPRMYRGRDITWWMDRCGVFDERYDDVDNVDRVRELPSFQLAGTDDRRTLDLNALTDIGIELRGKLAGVNQGKAQFSGSLPNLCALADLKMNRLLDRIDAWIQGEGMDAVMDGSATEGARHAAAVAASELRASLVDTGIANGSSASMRAAGTIPTGAVPQPAVAPPHRFAATRVPASPPLMLDLSRAGIRTILWATGFRPDYSWLDVPVLDHKGRISHDGGIAKAPGLYIIGLPFLRRRKSSLIDGAGDDARDLADHMEAWLAVRTKHSAPRMPRSPQLHPG